jgi:hypothetical protein
LHGEFPGTSFDKEYERKTLGQRTFFEQNISLPNAMLVFSWADAHVLQHVRDESNEKKTVVTSCVEY